MSLIASEEIHVPASESLPLAAGEVRGAALRRAMALVTVAWMFGSVWMNGVAGTPQTNYAKALGASKFQFGLLSALPFLASLVSLPASLIVEGTGRRKGIFLGSLYLNRLLWFPIALCPLWLVSHYGGGVNGHAISMFLWLIFLMHVTNAIGSPAWTTWMADLVPDPVRGRYFSRRRQWGALTCIPAVFIVGWLLDRNTGSADSLGMLRWCAIVFMCAAVFGVVDIHLFQYVPDIAMRPKKGLNLLKAWRKPLRNPQFLWFAGFVATLTFAVSFMGQFVTLYVMEQLGARGRSMNLLTQTMVLGAPAVAQVMVLSVWGRAADRMGKRPLLIVASLGLVPVALGWCFLNSSLIWLGYLLSGVGAALWAGVEVANFNLVLEMAGTAGDGDRQSGGSAYAAVNSVIINIAGCLGGLASGVIAQVLKDWSWNIGLKVVTFYDVLFALSALLRLVSVVVFLPHIREPEARPTVETLRFMSANIYNNLFNSVLLPLRVLGWGRKEEVEEAVEAAETATPG